MHKVIRLMFAYLTARWRPGIIQ